MGFLVFSSDVSPVSESPVSESSAAASAANKKKLNNTVRQNKWEGVCGRPVILLIHIKNLNPPDGVPSRRREAKGT